MSICPSPSSVSASSKKNEDGWLFGDILDVRLVSKKEMDGEGKMAESDGDSEKTADETLPFVQRKGKKMQTSTATPKRRACGVVIHDLRKGRYKGRDLQKRLREKRLMKRRRALLKRRQGRVKLLSPSDSA